MVTLSRSNELTAHSVLSAEVSVVHGQAPEWVQLVAMGSFRTRNGVPPVVILADRAQAEAVAAATAAYLGATDMVIDYDHQTVRAPVVGGKAEAAGWVKELEVRDDGIWGRVEWTAQASSELAAKRWRYLSPYFAHRPDGRVTKLINAGLTNTPNLELVAVASAIPETMMKDLKAIASALGLGNDADEAAILAAIAALNAGKTVLSATASALGAKDGDDLVALASAAVAKAATPDPAQFVPVSVLAEMKAEMSALSAKVDQAGEDRKKVLIDDAQAKGKLVPALRKHAETLDMIALASFLEALPETALGESVVPGGKASEDGKVQDEQLAIASMLGVSEEEYLKSQKEMEKR